MLFQTGQITGDGVLDIVQRLVPGLTLGNTAGQRGTFCHEQAVFVGLNMDTEFHADTIQVFRNLGKWRPLTEKEMTFESPLPRDFREALKLLQVKN